MMRDIIEQLKEIVENKYKTMISDQGRAEEEHELIHLINTIITELQKSKKQSLFFKSALLSDIDFLAEVLGKISLGNFDIEIPSMRVPEMDTVGIGIVDMETKLKEGNIAREEREMAEFEIKTQKSFIQDALDAQKDTFFVFDPFTGKALQWNKAFENISGYSTEEISSLKAPESYYSKEDLEKAGKYTARVLSGGAGTVEMELICKDGHRVPTEYSVSVIRSPEEDSKTLISIGRDITARKKAEEEKANLEAQLRQAQKMEAVGTLAGGIAHDFNNILAALLGYADMARDNIPDFSQAKDDIEEVLKAGNRAKDLVKHILTFSRKESRKRIPVEIHLIVKEALKLLRASIPTTINIKEEIDSDCGNILADPIQIHQILMNICTNSSQAMDEKGGILEVTLGCLELSEEDLQKEPTLKPGQYVKLTVSDNGPGIDEDNIERIFDPYFTTKEVGKGSGMGLAVVHGIVKSHDGMITVDSGLGKGTTFNVFFPRSEDILLQETEKEGPLPTGNERVLVVDDEESVVEITKRRLERLGYQVTSRTDSMTALELFRSQPGSFDLVISDQTMPGLTGEQLSQKIMEIRQDIPIIICTGYSSKMDAEKARFLGINAFIMKPVARKELAKTIRQVLDGETSADQTASDENGF